MPEGLVQVTEGSGKKLHTWQRTIGANNVEDEAVFPAEYPMPTYSVLVNAASIATGNDHIITLNAGASTYVRIRRIRLTQVANATTASQSRISLYRTTTAAPTGGTALTPNPFDSADSAASAAARSLPAAKGTEAAILLDANITWRQAILATGAQADNVWQWEQHPGSKPIIIPTGTTNGVALKTASAVAGATVNVYIEFVETAFGG